MSTRAIARVTETARPLTCAACGKRMGWQVGHGRAFCSRPCVEDFAQRDQFIREMAQSGMSCRQIGQVVGLTKARVSQILNTPTTEDA